MGGFQRSSDLGQKIDNCATELPRELRARFVNNSFQERRPLSEVLAIARSHFEATKQICVVRTPMIGLLPSLMKLPLGLMKRRYRVEWPTARSALGNGHGGSV